MCGYLCQCDDRNPHEEKEATIRQSTCLYELRKPLPLATELWFPEIILYMFISIIAKGTIEVRSLKDE